MRNAILMVVQCKQRKYVLCNTKVIVQSEHVNFQLVLILIPKLFSFNSSIDGDCGNH